MHIIFKTGEDDETFFILTEDFLDHLSIDTDMGKGELLNNITDLTDLDDVFGINADFSIYYIKNKTIYGEQPVGILDMRMTGIFEENIFSPPR